MIAISQVEKALSKILYSVIEKGVCRIVTSQQPKKLEELKSIYPKKLPENHRLLWLPGNIDNVEDLSLALIKAGVPYIKPSYEPHDLVQQIKAYLTLCHEQNILEVWIFENAELLSGQIYQLLGELLSWKHLGNTLFSFELWGNAQLDVFYQNGQLQACCCAQYYYIPVGKQFLLATQPKIARPALIAWILVFTLGIGMGNVYSDWINTHISQVLGTVDISPAKFDALIADNNNIQDRQSLDVVTATHETTFAKVSAVSEVEQPVAVIVVKISADTSAEQKVAIITTKISTDTTAEQSVAVITAKISAVSAVEQPMAVTIAKISADTALKHPVTEKTAEISADTDIKQPVTKTIAKISTDTALKHPVTKTITQISADIALKNPVTKTITQISADTALKHPVTKTITQISADTALKHPVTKTITQISADTALKHPVTEIITQISADTAIKQPVTETIAKISADTAIKQPVAETIAKISADTAIKQPVTETIAKISADSTVAKTPDLMFVNTPAMINSLQKAVKNANTGDNKHWFYTLPYPQWRDQYQINLSNDINREKGLFYLQLGIYRQKKSLNNFFNAKDLPIQTYYVCYSKKYALVALQTGAYQSVNQAYTAHEKLMKQGLDSTVVAINQLNQWQCSN